MSEKEQIEFLGYKQENRVLACIRDAVCNISYSRVELEERMRHMKVVGAPYDVTEKILAEWPEALPATTEREKRLEQALREIADYSVSHAEYDQVVEMDAREMQEIARKAIAEGTGE